MTSFQAESVTVLYFYVYTKIILQPKQLFSRTDVSLHSLLSMGDHNCMQVSGKSLTSTLKVIYLHNPMKAFQIMHAGILPL